VAVGDFTGNGILDLAVANSPSNTVSVLLGNGDGTFHTAPINYLAGNAPNSVAVGDFNGDDAVDLAVANSNSHDVSILLNDNAWPHAPRRPGGQPPGDGRAAAAAVEPRAAPAHALPPAADVLPTNAGLAVLGSPWAVTVPGPSRLRSGVDADPGAAAAAPAPSGAASPDVVAEAGGFFREPREGRALAPGHRSRAAVAARRLSAVRRRPGSPGEAVRDRTPRLADSAGWYEAGIARLVC
jgi:hypothetical protein